MHDDRITASPTASGQVRTLKPKEMPLLREHLLRLDPVSRRDRFNGNADDDFIERYAAKCQTDGTIVVAYVEDGVVRGAAELHQPGLSEPLPEIAFSVEAGIRRRGVGNILFTRLIEKARALGYERLRITTGSQNTAMRALAHKFGAELSFRRGESSGSIDLAPGKAAAAPLTPIDIAHAMMRFNRACWMLLLRIYGLGRAA